MSDGAPAEHAARAPLAGIRVLDFTANIAGPFGSMILADFGADVIKIEAPGGERGRGWGIGRFGPEGDISALFAAFNRNKRGLAIDLTREQGRAIVNRLVTEADVVVENYFPGVAEKLGIDYDSIRAIKPDIVYCRLSAFGANGPMRDRPGFDSQLQAYAGPQSITGEEGRAPSRIGPSTIDILSGAHAALGVLLALRHRDQTGEGQFVDTSLYDAAIQFMSPWIADYTGTGKVPGRFGPYFPMLVPSGNFAASDGDFYIAVSPGPMWERLCALIERPDLLDDERFRSNEVRCVNAQQLYDEVLIPIFRTKPRTFWVEKAVDNQIVASEINDVSAVVRQAQAAARELIVGVVGVERVKSAGIPIKLSATPGSIRSGPPTVGRDSHEILREAGVNETEISDLVASGVVMTR